MGIFKKIFGNGDEEEQEDVAAENEQPEEAEQPMPAKPVADPAMMQQRMMPATAVPTPEQQAEDSRIRRAAKDQIPAREQMFGPEAQGVIDSAFEAVFHCVNLNIHIVTAPDNKGLQLKVDPGIEQWIDHRERTTLDDDLAAADTNALLRLWVVLDMISGGNRLRGLSQIKDWMVDELVERKAVILPEKGSLEQLKEVLRSQQQIDQQRRMAESMRIRAQQAKNGNAAPVMPTGISENVIKAEKKLAEKMLAQDALWVAMDSFNSMYPSFGQLGQMEIFNSEETAKKAVEFMAEQRVSLSTIVKIEKEQYEAFFSMAVRNGATVFTVDNGNEPVTMQIGSMVKPVNDGLLENANRSIRNAIIREVQISTRMQKLNMTPSADAPAPERAQAQMMLTLRCNMFRVLGHGLVIVLGKDIPKGDGCTRYTPAAYQLACELKERHHLPEEMLCLPGDTKAEVYDGPLALQVMTPGTDKTASDGMLCLFTSKGPAAHVASASDSGLVVVTYQEWLVHAQKCSGVVVDPATLGYVIPAARYEEMGKYAAMDKPVMIRLQPEKTEEPKKEEENGAN